MTTVPSINDDGSISHLSRMEAAEKLYMMCRRHLNCQFDWDKPRLESLEVVILLETFCAQTGKISWRWRWNSMADRLVKIFRINEDPEELWNAQQEAAKKSRAETLNDKILSAFTEVLMYEDLQPPNLEIEVSTWFARERRRRFYWYCFENDVKAAVIGSRPPPFHKPSFKPGYPCSHALWIAADPLSQTPPSLPPHNEPRMDIGTASTYLHRILLEIHQLVWQTDPNKVAINVQYLSTIRDIENKLQEIKVPKLTVESLVSTAKAPGVESGAMRFLVIMFYQFCYLYLYQPGALSALMSHSTDIGACKTNTHVNSWLKAALYIAELCSVALAASPHVTVLDMRPFMATMIFMASLALISTYPLNKEVNLRALYPTLRLNTMLFSKFRYVELHDITQKVLEAASKGSEEMSELTEMVKLWIE